MSQTANEKPHLNDRAGAKWNHVICNGSDNEYLSQDDEES